MADSGQRTEEPTPRRLERARREGQFPASRDFVSAVQFLAFMAALAAWGGECCGGLQAMLRAALLRAGTETSGNDLAGPERS